MKRLSGLAMLACALTCPISSAVAIVTIYDDRAEFTAATSAMSLPIPTALPVVGCTQDLGSTCDNAITFAFASNTLALTAPLVDGSNCYAPLIAPICTTTPGHSDGFVRPIPKQTIAAHGEDDYVFEFASAVGSVGLELETNDFADETVTLRDASGNVIESISVDSRTNPGSTEFVGFRSTTPIKSLTLDTAHGAVNNEGITGILVSEIAAGSGGAPLGCLMRRARGLVAWWTGDGDAKDLAAGNDGTPAGGADFDAGKVGQAFRMNGGSVINIGTPATYSFIQNTGVFTIEAWSQLDNPNAIGSDGITGTTDGTAQRGHFFVWAHLGTRQLRLFLSRGIPGSPMIDSYSPANVIADARWHHVAAVGDGANVTFYVDGVSFPGSGTMGTPSTGDSANLLGLAQLGSSTPSFRGRLDEVAIYDLALSACEIKAIYLAGEPGTCKRDADSDGVPDFRDKCPEQSNPGQLDTDGDGFGDVCDCAPNDPSVFGRPGDFRGPVISRSSSAVVLDWCPDSLDVGPATTYDILRGVTTELPVGGGASEMCLENNLAATTTQDGTVPASGQAFWYLLRGANSCGIGTYGFQSNGTERLSSSCP